MVPGCLKVNTDHISKKGRRDDGTKGRKVDETTGRRDDRTNTSMSKVVRYFKSIIED